MFNCNCKWSLYLLMYLLNFIFILSLNRTTNKKWRMLKCVCVCARNNIVVMAIVKCPLVAHWSVQAIQGSIGQANQTELNRNPKPTGPSNRITKMCNYSLFVHPSRLITQSNKHTHSSIPPHKVPIFFFLFIIIIH